MGAHSQCDGKQGILRISISFIFHQCGNVPTYCSVGFLRNDLTFVWFDRILSQVLRTLPLVLSGVYSAPIDLLLLPIYLQEACKNLKGKVISTEYLRERISEEVQ